MALRAKLACGLDPMAHSKTVLGDLCVLSDLCVESVLANRHQPVAVCAKPSTSRCFRPH
jgi:hypothetical protein